MWKSPLFFVLVHRKKGNKTIFLSVRFWSLEISLSYFSRLFSRSVNPLKSKNLPWIFTNEAISLPYDLGHSPKIKMPLLRFRSWFYFGWQWDRKLVGIVQHKIDVPFWRFSFCKKEKSLKKCCSNERQAANLNFVLAL